MSVTAQEFNAVVDILKTHLAGSEERSDPGKPHKERTFACSIGFNGRGLGLMEYFDDRAKAKPKLVSIALSGGAGKFIPIMTIDRDRPGFVVCDRTQACPEQVVGDVIRQYSEPEVD